MDVKLYTPDDLKQSGMEKKRARMKTLLCALPMLVLAVAGFALRVQVLCIAGVLLAGVLLILLWDLWAAPAARYDRFLREIHSGTTHDTLGALVRVSEDLSYEEGVYLREVILNIYEDMDEEGERRFLMDARRELPAHWLGRDIVLTSHGNVILSARVYEKGTGV